MEHQVNTRIVLNVSALLRGAKSEEAAQEQVEQEIHDLLESLTGRPCSDFFKPSIVDQTFSVADIETTGCYEASQA